MMFLFEYLSTSSRHYLVREKSLISFILTFWKHHISSLNIRLSYASNIMLQLRSTFLNIQKKVKVFNFYPNPQIKLALVLLTNFYRCTKKKKTNKTNLASLHIENHFSNQRNSRYNNKNAYKYLFHHNIRPKIQCNLLSCKE